VVVETFYCVEALDLVGVSPILDEHRRKPLCRYGANVGEI